MLSDFQIQFFVLDVVTMFLVIALIMQSYFIYQMSKKISSQNEELISLKKIVTTIYTAHETSKVNLSSTQKK